MFKYQFIQDVHVCVYNSSIYIFLPFMRPHAGLLKSAVRYIYICIQKNRAERAPPFKLTQDIFQPN